MARALAAAIAVSLLAVSGAGGAGAQTPKRGGTVVVSNVTAPCLNALLPKCNFAFRQAEEVLEGAFEPDPNGVLRPRLVTHVDVEKTPPSTLTYHIRREARWSDNVPITAHDFVFTHEAVLRHDSPEFLEVYRSVVRRVSVVDAKTVRVVLQRKYAGWRGLLFWVVVPRHALRGEDLERVWIDRIDNPKTGEPIGSGPLLVESWEREGRFKARLTLVRNPRYWGKHTAYLDRVVLRGWGPEEFEDAAEALEKGAIDVINGSIPEPSVVLDIRRLHPNIRVSTADGANLQHVAIRMLAPGHPALRDKRVRRALAYGIDRAALATTLYGQVAPALRPSDSVVFHTRSPHYRPNWKEYAYRLDEARRLLEAVCDRGADGIFVCAGERLELRLVAQPSTRNRNTAPILQEQLRRVGVDVVPVFADSSTVRRILDAGDFDLALLSLVYTPDQTGWVDSFGCDGPFNVMRYCQRLATADLDQADRIFDAGQRARVLNRADARMAKDVPVIPLYNAPTYAAVRSNVRGYVPSFPFALWRAENLWLER